MHPSQLPLSLFHFPETSLLLSRDNLRVLDPTIDFQDAQDNLHKKILTQSYHHHHLHLKITDLYQIKNLIHHWRAHSYHIIQGYTIQYKIPKYDLITWYTKHTLTHYLFSNLIIPHVLITIIIEYVNPIDTICTTCLTNPPNEHDFFVTLGATTYHTNCLLTHINTFDWKNNNSKLHKFLAFFAHP